MEYKSSTDSEKRVTKYAALDTNCLLHFQSPEHVDWLTVLEAPSVILMVFPAVLRELERQKNEAPAGTRARAQKGAAKLDKLGGSEIREGVFLKLVAKEPMIDFEANQLDWRLADDRLVASMIEFGVEDASANVVLVTDDTLLKLKAESRSLVVVRPPEKYRLPEGHHPLEEENRRLQSELDSLQNRLPSLDVEFQSSGHKLEIVLPAPDLPDDAELERRLAEIRTRYPRRRVRRLEWGIPGASEQLVEEWNQKLEKFYEEYRLYLNENRQYDFVEASKILVELRLNNSGKSPATDIDVEILCQGETLQLVKAADFPERPQEPRPPESGLSFLRVTLPPIVPLAEQLERLKEPDVSSQVERSQTHYSMKVHVKRLKHGNAIDLPAFLILTQRNSTSIGLKCRITCSELSKPSERNLGVLVKY